MLPWTKWLWAYCPVRYVARDGQHNENETTLFANVTPLAAINACTFVSTRIDSRVWSSVMTMTMFGCSAVARATRAVAPALPDGPAPIPAPASATTVAVIPATLRTRRTVGRADATESARP